MTREELEILADDVRHVGGVTVDLLGRPAVESLIALGASVTATVWEVRGLIGVEGAAPFSFQTMIACRLDVSGVAFHATCERPATLAEAAALADGAVDSPHGPYAVLRGVEPFPPLEGLARPETLADRDATMKLAENP